MAIDPNELRRIASTAREQQAQLAAYEAEVKAREATQRKTESAKAYNEEKSRLQKMGLQSQAEHLMHRAASGGMLASEFEVAAYDIRSYSERDNSGRYSEHLTELARERDVARQRAATEVAQQVADELNKTQGVHARVVERPALDASIGKVPWTVNIAAGTSIPSESSSTWMLIHSRCNLGTGYADTRGLVHNVNMLADG